MRKAWADVWSWLSALADRARFYFACVTEGDLHDACLVIIVFTLIFVGIIMASWCLTLGWVSRVVR